MRLKLCALPMLLVIAGVITSSPPKARAAAPQAPRYDDRPGWDAPPTEFREVQRQGFHDGIEGARRDFDHHRMPNVNNREEYRHPHVDPSMRGDYREGYRRGYDVAMHHLMGDTPR